MNKDEVESPLGVQQKGPSAAAPPPPLHHCSLLCVPVSNLRRRRKNWDPAHKLLPGIGAERFHTHTFVPHFQIPIHRECMAALPSITCPVCRTPLNLADYKIQESKEVQPPARSRVHVSPPPSRRLRGRGNGTPPSLSPTQHTALADQGHPSGAPAAFCQTCVLCNCTYFCCSLPFSTDTIDGNQWGCVGQTLG